MKLVLIGIFLLVPVASTAEVYQCGKVWRDIPCDTVRPPRTRSARQSSPRAALAPGSKSQEEKPRITPAGEPAASPRKDYFIDSLVKMNRTCGNFYSLKEVSNFSRFCRQKATPVKACEAEWVRLYSEMLGNVPSEKCRNMIFNTSNQYRSIK